ncbi:MULTISPECIES: amino acid ABC transporter permease [Paenibacillus]|uniref:amino acid ABC transporter permease n=1 Tax=Paenibacillus TaxID=44249 RepID=UPI0022B89E73|nr:amino acid ABC transporter permease [Paenibacillus caseinilyticus]MCZ8523201.1 amino acid ABC transporter permease [Paenibacillus caseinilyticus]
MLRWDILIDNWDTYIMGFGNTVKSSLIALVGSFILGAVIAVFRISPLKPLNWFGTAYVEFLRNIPLLLIVWLVYLSAGNLHLPLDGFMSGTFALTIYTSAFIAEAIRAGIQAVPKGQMEAGRSSGLSYLQTMQYIILPQALRIVIPPLGNQFLNLVKNSSVLAVIGGMDLMYFGDIISTEVFVTFSVYIFVAMFYLILTIPIAFGVRYLERRLAH